MQQTQRRFPGTTSTSYPRNGHGLGLSRHDGMSTFLQRTGFYLIPGGLVVLAALLFFRGSEEDRIRARLEALRALVEVRGQQSTIKQATVARQIGEYFSEQTRFDLTGPGYRIVEIPCRRELVRKVLQGRAALASLELGFDRLKLNVEGGSASVAVTGSVLGTLRDSSGQFLDIHRIEITLRKEDDGWQITGGRHIRDERAQNDSRFD